MKVSGIDLAGKEENSTGFCVLDDSGAETKLLKSDQEIVEEVKKAEPDLIAVDAPLDFPEDGMYRDCDLKLKERGFEPLSPQFPGMKILVKRAKGLLKKLDKIDRDFEVVEVFPDASKEILSLEQSETANQDEFDALICAITGKKYLQGDYENLDGIIIPRR